MQNSYSLRGPRYSGDTSFPRATQPTQEAKTSNTPRVSIQKHRGNAVVSAKQNT